MRILTLNLNTPLLTLHFKEAGFVLDVAEDADDAISLLALDYDYGCLVFYAPKRESINIPVQLVRAIRNKKIETPLICLTDRDDTAFRIGMLNIGCDTILELPIDKFEAEAYVSATIRRGRGLASPKLKLGVVKIDLIHKDITAKGETIHLTNREWSVFEMLALAKGHPVSLERIYEHIEQDGEHVDGSKLIDVFICKINRKFRKVLGDKNYPVKTIWGRGRYLDLDILKGEGGVP